MGGGGGKGQAGALGGGEEGGGAGDGYCEATIYEVEVGGDELVFLKHQNAGGFQGRYTQAGRVAFGTGTISFSRFIENIVTIILMYFV